jgi:hypothetical protein
MENYFKLSFEINNNFIIHRIEFQVMGNCENNEKFVNTRVILQLTHERNEKLASYIRLTDGAIWGFLGLSAIEFFKESFCFQSTNVLIFLILFVVSMFMWRKIVNRFQESIVDCYYQEQLPIPYEIKLRKNLERDNNFSVASTTEEERENFKKLYNILNPKTYKVKHHIVLNRVAFALGILDMLGIIFWFSSNWLIFFRIFGYCMVLPMA